MIQSLFDNDIDDEFVKYLDNLYILQKEYYGMLIERTKYIDYKKIDRHLNNQISIAISWCEKYKLSINKMYESTILVDIKLLRRYFKYEPGINMNKIKMTSDSLYSVSYPDVADKMSKIIKDIMPLAKSIIDGTANIGGNTISFASYFDKVTAVEINDKTCDVLKNNVNVYNRKNVNVICGDFVELSKTLSADVIFIDPPWSGMFYKMYTDIDLYLSDINIIDLISTFKCDLVALKLPLNYNIKGMLNKYEKLRVFKVHNVLLMLK